MSDEILITAKDLPKLTKVGSYQVNIPLVYLQENIERFVWRYNLNLLPDFQRGHVWKEEQQIKYVEFLLMGGNSQNIIYFNHPGWMNSWEGDFVIVDGLQRVTAVLDFFENKFKVFGKYYRRNIEIYFSTADLVFNINNLKTRKEVIQWYLEINENGTPHTTEEINRVKKLLEDASYVKY